MYTIEQLCDNGQYEPIPNGECDTEQDARRYITELVFNLGWTGLRIVADDGTVIAL